MENLGRGVVALHQGDGKVFVSWRLLGTDPDGIAFNLYRAAGNDAPVSLNREPLARSTCYADTGVDVALKSPTANGMGCVNKEMKCRGGVSNEAGAPASGIVVRKAQLP